MATVKVTTLSEETSEDLLFFPPPMEDYFQAWIGDRVGHDLQVKMGLRKLALNFGYVRQDLSQGFQG